MADDKLIKACTDCILCTINHIDDNIKLWLQSVEKHDEIFDCINQHCQPMTNKWLIVSTNASPPPLILPNATLDEHPHPQLPPATIFPQKCGLNQSLLPWIQILCNHWLLSATVEVINGSEKLFFQLLSQGGSKGEFGKLSFEDTDKFAENKLVSTSWHNRSMPRTGRELECDASEGEVASSGHDKTKVTMGATSAGGRNGARIGINFLCEEAE